MKCVESKTQTNEPTVRSDVANRDDVGTLVLQGEISGKDASNEPTVRSDMARRDDFGTLIL